MKVSKLIKMLRRYKSNELFYIRFTGNADEDRIEVTAIIQLEPSQSFGLKEMTDVYKEKQK